MKLQINWLIDWLLICVRGTVQDERRWRFSSVWQRTWVRSLRVHRSCLIASWQMSARRTTSRLDDSRRQSTALTSSTSLCQLKVVTRSFKPLSYIRAIIYLYRLYSVLLRSRPAYSAQHSFNPRTSHDKRGQMLEAEAKLWPHGQRRDRGQCYEVKVKILALRPADCVVSRP